MRTHLDAQQTPLPAPPTATSRAVPAGPDDESTATPVQSTRGWRRWGIWVLLASTATLYLWGLSRNGWANAFYSAAAQAGSVDWQAWFFGSSDAANSITVDKPPLSTMLMALSARIFGVNYWSILVPHALAGVASVAVLYAAVKRWYGPAAGLLAGTLLAVTPAAVLMFRFNNPDALLVLLLVTAAYATVRATETASPRWLMLAGALVGMGFLTKMLQAFLVLPALALTYLVAAPSTLWRRLRDLVLEGIAMVVAGGWWVLAVELWPASDRPYIGGSQTNSVLELIWGYNGLGRITGNEVGSVGGGGAGGGAGPGGGPGGGFGGTTGVDRLLGAAWAGGIAWLLASALVFAVGVLWLTRRAGRTDRLRAGVVLWGVWSLVTWGVFSFASGIIHEYYAIALAPGLAALVAIGFAVTWSHRDQRAGRLFLATGIISAGVTSAWIMAQAGGGYTVAGLMIGAVAGVAGVVLGSPAALDVPFGRIAATVSAAALFIAPMLFAIPTALTAHSGSIPTVNPTLAGGMVGPGGGMPGGQGGANGIGGLLNAPTVDGDLVTVLNADADQYTWVAAGVGSMTTAGYQLATGNPVMPVGGFNGSDPSPTLAEFQQLVADGDIHYFIGGGGFGPSNGGSQSSSQIAEWVSANFTEVTLGDVVLYDLTAPVGDSGSDASRS